MKPDFTADFLFSVRGFIARENLFLKEEKLLCAVSGGVDSMVLVFVLLELGYDLEIAHFNYGLRGNDSDADEALVKNWAELHQIPFHRNSPGPGFRSQSGISLQEEARNLRYEWMEKLVEERGISHLILAHHGDDQVETIFLNLLRGAGLAGMRGMLPAQGKRKRPLLEKTRADIRTFAEANGIAWREDASNAKNDYRRNQLRNQILPLLREMAPGFEHAVLRNADRFRLYEPVLEDQFQDLEKQFLRFSSEDKKSYDLPSVRAHPQGKFFFFERLKKAGFGWEEMEQLWASATSEESIGRLSTEGTQVEIRFPNLLVWSTKSSEGVPFPVIASPETSVIPFPNGRTLNVSTREISESEAKKITPFQWISDPENVAFPLTFRFWKEGDSMKPFGMKGRKKKVSDLLTEAKLSLREKERQVVMVDAKGGILWIPGIRTSEQSRLKVTRRSKVILLEIQ
jgi:tRNA(Ile)-lysidine synthase